MASLTYIDEPDLGRSGHFVQHSIADLTFSLLDSESPSDAVQKAARLAQLLLLSNQTDQAYTLICALYKHYEALKAQSSSSSASLDPPGSQHFVYFLETHPAGYAHPLGGGRGNPQDAQKQDASAAHRSREMRQWHEYRECTRTGWMLEHCNLPEPEDPHVWRETDDAAMIAMCARLLAKNKTPGEYPPEEDMREALAAARKLYAQPQVPITEWQAAKAKEEGGGKTARRHSYLLYRRLVVELAIRVGDLETAAEVLSLGLTLDGFNSMDGGQLGRYLFLPRIYEVLPLLAKRGLAGNPYFINADDAAAMAREVAAALEQRATGGRQWALAPDKVGWRELLDRLAAGAWAVNRKSYENQGLECAADVLMPPATEEEIAEAEAKVGELPSDFKDMVRLANGFHGGWHLFSGGISGIEDIDIAEEGLDAIELSLGYDFDYGEDDGDGLSLKVIEVFPGTECDSYRHYIVPPATWRRRLIDSNDDVLRDGEYRYCHGASWSGEISSWESVRHWVASCVEEVERMVKEGSTVDSEDMDEE